MKHDDDAPTLGMKPRMTHEEWTRWTRDRRSWRRRVVTTAAATVIAEAACALAWTSLTAALNSPGRKR